jgi:hypothetical protein
MAPNLAILIDHFKLPILIWLAVLFSILYAINSVFFTIHYPADLPRIYERPGKSAFSIRTRWKYLSNCQKLFSDAYETVSPPFGSAASAVAPLLMMSQ